MLKTIAIIVILFGVITSGCYNYPMFKSCKEIRDHDRALLSGLYWIKTPTGPLQVYCEMGLHGGGFTFLPRDISRVDILSLFKQKDQVLLQHQREDGSQPSTLIKQLPQFSNTELSVMKNSYNGYKKPVNTPHLGQYIFLGLLPQHLAKRRTKLGFVSNDQEVTYKNCDGNPNNYFAFFPDHEEKKPLGYHPNPVYETRGVAVDWRKTGRKMPSHRTMPNNFFFLTEIHFGGCGTYTSSDRWRGARGTAIGVR